MLDYSSKMDARSLAAEVEDFDAKLEDFYRAFKKGKKVFLDETTNDPLRNENERLRRELKASEDENYYLKEDLQTSQAKARELQRKLDAKENLLSTISAYATGSSARSDRKREISPVPDADRERERKRSRDQYSQQPSRHSREDYTIQPSYQDQRNGEARDYERSDSGFVSDSPHHHRGPPSAPASAFKNPQLGRATSPPQHPRHHRSAQDRHPESPNGGISIMGAAQHGTDHHSTHKCIWTNAHKWHTRTKQQTHRIIIRSVHVALCAMHATPSERYATLAKSVRIVELRGSSASEHFAQLFRRRKDAIDQSGTASRFMMSRAT